MREGEKTLSLFLFIYFSFSLWEREGESLSPYPLSLFWK